MGVTSPNSEMPDVVVSGINTGANLGVDLYYSGTAAAAREAAMMGIPALAISRYMQPDVNINWDNLAGHVTSVIRALIAEDYRLPVGQFWNVNFPSVNDDHHAPEIHFARQGTLPHQMQFQEERVSENQRALTYSGNFRDRGRSADCDVKVLFDGHITASPIQLESTASNKVLQQKRLMLGDR